MRGSSRWMILIAVLPVALAGCGGTTSAVRRQPTPAAGQPTATGTRAAATATPAAPSNTVYYLAQNPTSPDDGTVVALNVSDGSVRWKFDAKRVVPPVAESASFTSKPCPAGCTRWRGRQARCAG